MNKKGRAKKVLVSDVLPLLAEYRGNIVAIARALGVTRQTVYNRINESPMLQAALVDARETMLDMAESTLYNKVLQGDNTALIFFLKTQGRSRGYIERQEQAFVGSGPHIQVYLPDNERDG